MPYSNNIPQATDRLNDSQSLMLANFAAIETVVSVDHINFDAASGDQGKHNVVTMPRRTVAPIHPVTGLTEVALYSALSPLSGETEIFVARENGTASYEITAALGGNEGWTRLPSGILIKWARGMITTAVPGDTIYTYPVNAVTIPVFGDVYNTQITTQVTSGGEDKIVTLVQSLVATVTTFGSLRSSNLQREVNYTILTIGI